MDANKEGPLVTIAEACALVTESCPSAQRYPLRYNEVWWATRRLGIRIERPVGRTLALPLSGVESLEAWFCPGGERVIAIALAARLFGCTELDLRLAVKHGEITPVRNAGGTAMWFRARDLEAWKAGR